MKPVVNRLSFAKAQLELGRLAKRVHRDKEYFIVEEAGAPVIGIMDAGELENYLQGRDRKPERSRRTNGKGVRSGTDVVQTPVSRTKRRRSPGGAPTLGQRLMRFAGSVKGLPRDMAKNHDHYIHGAPRE